MKRYQTSQKPNRKNRNKIWQVEISIQKCGEVEKKNKLRLVQRWPAHAVVPSPSESTAASMRPVISPEVSAAIAGVTTNAHAGRRDVECNAIEHGQVGVWAVTFQDRLANFDLLEVGEANSEGEGAVCEGNLAVGRDGG